jgi:SAM-dependent methyltransferase
MASIVTTTQTDGMARRHRQLRVSHQDQVTRDHEKRYPLNRYYHQRITEVYRTLISPGQRVLDLGCGTGELLSALEPSYGVGVDFSPQVIALARRQHPELQFIEADLHELEFDQKFDVIILSDVVGDLFDIQAVLSRVATFCEPHTRVILNFYSRLWQAPLALARRAGLAKPVTEQNWVTPEDVGNLLGLANFEVIRNWSEVLCPLRVPGLNWLCDRVLAKLWPFHMAALSNFVVARPKPHYDDRVREPTVSVIVPARNEAGNVPHVFKRTPDMAGGTELIFVEGGSSDGTYEAAERQMQTPPFRRAKLLRQTGRGKGDAVRLGFAHATGDILAILDADLTMPPEELSRFVEALRSGHGEFINGVRLVYPMEQNSMRFLNLVANKFFSLAFSWLLDQPIKDTLCGTKVLWRKDYERIAANRDYFGDFDPYGDFDLIFGAAKMNLRIIDMPMRYRARTYGETNIHRWSGGWLLLRMVAFAARRLKFV